jgi:hypothetical protein
MATCTPPIPITDKILTACSVAEPSTGEAAWASGTTYAAGAKAIIGRPSATVTITIAAPGVVTMTGHGLPNGTPVILTTTGALPTGLTAGDIYYAVNRATDTFQLSTTVDGAPITTTGSQSGVHTAAASVHRLYESVTGSNVGNPPAIDDGTKWLDLGPTNLWSMFDLYRPSITWATSPVTFTLTPGRRVRSIFLGSMLADQVDVVMKVSGSPVYTATRTLLTRKTITYTDFCFKPFTQKPSVQLLDLPPYTAATIEVTITRANGPVGIGEVVIGNPVYLGKTQHGAEAKTRNYTKFDRNTDGTPTAPVRRRNVPTSAQTIWFDKENAQILTELRDATNGVVAVWSGLDDDTSPYFEPVLILGLATTFDINLAQPNTGILSLVAEEY